MSEPTGRPARYQRTFGGLVGSMIVLLLVVGAFVLFRSQVRTDPDGRPTAVDWQQTVSEIQAADDPVVHPTKVPDGWTVTSANYRPGRVPEDRVWDLGALTEDDDFVGLAQTGTSLDDLVRTYVDDEATEGDPVTLQTPLGSEWRTWTDGGGDYALGTALTGPLAGQFLLVYGSAPDSVVRDLAASLTTAPVAQAS